MTEEFELARVSGGHLTGGSRRSSDSGAGHMEEGKRERGGLHRMGNLALYGPREIDGSPYVHIYSLVEWKDSDFWRALVGGTSPPLPPAPVGVERTNYFWQSFSRRTSLFL
jgi:hypothetical protein